MAQITPNSVLTLYSDHVSRQGHWRAYMERVNSPNDGALTVCNLKKKKRVIRYIRKCPNYLKQRGKANISYSRAQAKNGGSTDRVGGAKIQNSIKPSLTTTKTDRLTLNLSRVHLDPISIMAVFNKTKWKEIKFCIEHIMTHMQTKTAVQLVLV